ncbi:MFS transporter [Kitasatospora sp. NPDC002040]|uniref:MFS transporter n=1 Tax=Kitasatospora sp. NPDC002040 TaxID=3154661 RepID=UPI00332D862D
MSVLDGTAVQNDNPALEPRMSKRQRAILILLLSSTFLLAADFSLLTVAIPVIGDGLGFAVGDLQWISTAFAITSAGFTLLFGRIADLYGRRRMFLAGLALLALSSLLGAAANEPLVLIIARVLQGVATAMATPAALALLTTSFPEGPLRAKALGVNGAMISAGFTVGAVAGGLLTDLLSWRWAFLINVPIAVAIIVLTPRLLPESRLAGRAKMDVPGAVTVSTGLIALVYGVSRAGEEGWGDALVLVLLAAAAVLLTVFYRIELRAESPLASVRILNKPSVLWGNFGGLIAITMQTAVIFLATLYLQKVNGLSAMDTGLAFSGLGIAAFVGGVVAPKVVGRFGNRLGLVIGLTLQVIGPIGLALTASADSSILLVLVLLTVASFGHLTAVVSYMITSTSGLPNEEQGLATGLATMTQQVGLAVGIPVMSAIATTRIHAMEATHSATDSVLSGLRLAFTLDAGVVVLGGLLILVFLRSRKA